MEDEVGRRGILVAVQNESAGVIGEPTKVAVVLVLPVVTELHDHDWILSPFVRAASFEDLIRLGRVAAGRAGRRLSTRCRVVPEERLEPCQLVVDKAEAPARMAELKYDGRACAKSPRCSPRKGIGRSVAQGGIPRPSRGRFEASRSLQGTAKESAMKNTGYVIHLTTKLGRTTSYLKDDDGWTQIRPTGLVRTGITAEQLLSHLLPPLAGYQPSLSVRVERR